MYVKSYDIVMAPLQFAQSFGISELCLRACKSWRNILAMKKVQPETKN